MDEYKISGAYKFFKLKIEFEGNITINNKGTIEGKLTEQKTLLPNHTLNGKIINTENHLVLITTSNETKQPEFLYSLKQITSQAKNVGIYKGKYYMIPKHLVGRINTSSANLADTLNQTKKYDRGDDILFSMTEK